MSGSRPRSIQPAGEPPLRVGWLVWGDEPGGVASAVLNNGEQLRRLGQQVSLWSLGPGTLVDTARGRGWMVRQLETEAGLHARYIGYGFSPTGVLRRARVLLGLQDQIGRWLRAQAAPQVLCLPWPDLMPLAGAAARRLGIGLVLEMPNTPSRYPLDLNQRVYAWAVRRWRVRMLANSEYSAGFMGRIPGVTVVTPAVDARRFDPARVKPLSRTTLGIPYRATVLGLIARLDPSKGADLLIAALAALGADGEDLHLLLIGGPLDSDYGRQLQAQAVTAGVAERLHLLDTVADPERYWPLCDLAVNPRRDAEPFGLSVVEAMLMARPVLAHSLGQPGLSLRDGETGWLYHRPSVETLVETLRRALAQREHWSEIGWRAREEALQRFADPALGRRYLGLLREQARAAREARP